MRRKATIITLLLIFESIITACNSSPKVDWELTFSGAVSNPTTISYAELTDMEFIALDNVLMEKTVGEDEVGK